MCVSQRAEYLDRLLFFFDLCWAGDTGGFRDLRTLCVLCSPAFNAVPIVFVLFCAVWSNCHNRVHWRRRNGCGYVETAVCVINTVFSSSQNVQNVFVADIEPGRPGKKVTSIKRKELRVGMCKQGVHTDGFTDLLNNGRIFPRRRSLRNKTGTSQKLHAEQEVARTMAHCTRKRQEENWQVAQSSFYSMVRQIWAAVKTNLLLRCIKVLSASWNA